MRQPIREERGIKVGRPHVKLAQSSHVPGVPEGNARGNTRQDKGLRRRENLLVARPSRSTGIAPRARAPIDARMPVLTAP